MAPPAISSLAKPSSPDISRSSAVVLWDSEALCRRAKLLELEESAAMLVNPSLLSTLEDLLLEVYAMLSPKPIDYEQRNIMVNVFNKMANEIFGKKNGFPVVEAFGSFTMDLFTPKSDLDLSVNFNADTEGQFARQSKISVIRKFAKVLYSHQKHGRCSGVLPIVSARVPVLKVVDRGTGIECDISVDNKDGVSRSIIFKLISSLDERFRILCYLIKFWAKTHDVNSSKDRTMSSMSIISLVAFHLQTRNPPILPAFSALLKDGSGFASVERNILLFKEFGSRNRESVAELFVSLMSKLLSVESLWEQGLCASNFEGFWISKAWKKGVGNLSVEDFLDRSQNFARSVGKVEMQKICECLRVSVVNLSNFFSGTIDAPKLRDLLFGPLNQDKLVSHSHLKHAKRKRDFQPEPENRYERQKRVKHNVTASDLPTPTIYVPLHMHQIDPIQPSTHFGHRSQHQIAPLGHRLQPHFPVTPHSSLELLDQPRGNLIHFNRGIQLQQQGQYMFAPLPVHQPPVINMAHHYSYNGSQHLQYNENRMLQRMPYGNSANYWR